MDPGGRRRGARSKVRMLSPIREMSGVVPVKVVPKGTKVMKGGPGHAPIFVQALPPQVGVVKPTMKPSERRYTDVDQVVADYLHYARYGQVMPVLHGAGTGVGGAGAGLSCPCCADRNRENVHRKMALERGAELSNPDMPHSSRSLTPPSDTPLLSEDTPRHIGEEELPLSSHQREREGGGSGPGVSPRRNPTTSVNQTPPRHAQGPWGQYQPTPLAGTFLNPEFNRPFVAQSAEEDAGRGEAAGKTFTMSKVLEASSKYEQSMQKLQNQLNNGFELPTDVIYEGWDKYTDDEEGGRDEGGKVGVVE